MRFPTLAVLVAGVVLAACSKPEPAAGAPSPDAVAVDSTKAPDSAATGMADSAKSAADPVPAPADTTKPAADSAKASIAAPDSASPTDSAAKP